MTFRALDLCAGAGGLSLGLQRAGFDVLGVELDPDACATHRANVGPCVEASIVGWRPDADLGRVDLAAGGVPCTEGAIKANSGHEDVSPRPSQRPSGDLADQLAASGLLDRTSTTIAGDPRLSTPGHHANAKTPGTAARGMGARLSLEHRAILQGFPPGFVFHGQTAESRDRQCGNAVPPQLAEAVGRSVAAALRAADAARDAAIGADRPSPIPPAPGRV